MRRDGVSTQVPALQRSTAVQTPRPAASFHARQQRRAGQRRLGTRHRPRRVQDRGTGCAPQSCPLSIATVLRRARLRAVSCSDMRYLMLTRSWLPLHSGTGP